MNLKRTAGLLISFILIAVLFTVYPALADDSSGVTEGSPDTVESPAPAETASEEAVSRENVPGENSVPESDQEQNGASGEVSDGAVTDVQEEETAGNTAVDESKAAENNAVQESGSAENREGQDPNVSGDGNKESDGLGTVPSKPYGQIVSVDADTASGTAAYTIEVHAPSKIKSVVVPTWSYQDQRDIIWYEAKPGDDGLYHCSFNIASHNYHWAKYISHIYAVEENGSTTYIDGISTGFGPPGDTPEAVINDMVFTLSMPKGDYPGLSELKAAVWSETGGQDDLFWITLPYDSAQGKYTVSFPASKLKHGGMIDIHVYAFGKSGGSAYAGGVSVSLDTAVNGTVGISDLNQDNGKFTADLKLNEGSGPASEVRFAIWCSSDQSDLKWYTASKQKDGSYAVSASIAGHNYHQGKYIVHVYAYSPVTGEYFFAGGAAKLLELSGNVSLDESSAGTRTLTVSGFGAGLKELKAAAWSTAGGQDDLHWISMTKNTGGSWTCEIKAEDFAHGGNCAVHVYSGNVYIGGKSFTIAQSEIDSTTNIMQADFSGSTITIKLLHPYVTYKTMKAAVWSEEKGQDDLGWYEMKKTASGFTATVSTSGLKHGGDCNIHLYANGNTYAGGKTISVTLSHSTVSWNPSWEFAGYSQIHSGTATMYRATSNRKEIVVGINAGHGTADGESYYVYSHPDMTPKTTGGSTAEGAVFTQCDNTGMIFNDGTPESAVTLQMAFILKEMLLNAGYDVLMVRETEGCSMDVVARTVMCNNLADCHISLHWDGDGLPYDKGCFFCSVPAGIKNMYPTSTVWTQSNNLGNCVINGLRSKGLPIYGAGYMDVDLMQTSYSKVPSIDIELGNGCTPHRDSDLRTRASGILAGLDLFFG